MPGLLTVGIWDRVCEVRDIAAIAEVIGSRAFQDDAARGIRRRGAFSRRARHLRRARFVATVRLKSGLTASFSAPGLYRAENRRAARVAERRHVRFMPLTKAADEGPEYRVPSERIEPRSVWCVQAA